MYVTLGEFNENDFQIVVQCGTVLVLHFCVKYSTYRTYCTLQYGTFCAMQEMQYVSYVRVYSTVLLLLVDRRQVTSMNLHS